MINVTMITISVMMTTLAMNVMTTMIRRRMVLRAVVPRFWQAGLELFLALEFYMSTEEVGKQRSQKDETLV